MGILDKLKHGVSESAKGWAGLVGLPIWTEGQPLKVPPKGPPSTIHQEVEFVENGQLAPGLVGNYAKYNNLGKAFPQLQPTLLNQETDYPTIQGSYNYTHLLPTIQKSQPSANLMDETWATEPVNYYKSTRLRPTLREKLPVPNRSVLDYLDQI